MAPSPPTLAKPSKGKHVAKFLQRGVSWARDAISSRSSPSSRPSSPLLEVKDSPGFATPSALDSFPIPEITPASSALSRRKNSLDSSAPTVSNTFPSTSSDLPAANTVKEASGIAWNGLKTVLSVLEKTADVFPPLKSVVAGLLACIDVVEAAAGNREDYEELSAELTTMAATLERVSKLASGDRDGSIACILQSVKIEVNHISKQQAHGMGRRIIESPQDRDDILKRFRRIESLFRRLQSDISVRTWDTTRKLHETSLLQGLSSVDAAGYDSKYSTTIKRRECTEKTREKIRCDIEEWVIDPNGAKVYWMNGMAGTGKTTILYSLCKWLEENRLLGANFFCSRILDSCRSANNIIPTLAYQLARYSSAFRAALCNCLEEDPDVAKRDIHRQFKKLVLEPMKEVKDAMPEGVVVVIDALDECSDSAVVRLLLGLVLEHARILPVKFIVTSRPEPEIRNKMLASGFLPSVLHLHDIEESIVEADIKKYLTEELRAMDPTPTPDQVEQLARHAGKLFIYAATAVRYIDPGNSRVDSRHRLRIVLQTVSSSENSKQYERLDELYTDILSAAFSSDLEDRETTGIRLVLQSVICAKEPLSVETLAWLLGLEEDTVKTSLEPLRSVLHVQERGGLVSALHASFPDYMFNSVRCGEKFYCDQTQHSEILASGCFDVMKSQLRFNICNLKSSFVFDEDVLDLDGRVKTHISRGLSYACQYWGEHLRRGTFTDRVHEKLVEFLKHRLLFWMEVLNLERQMTTGSETLWKIKSWLERMHTDTCKQVEDTEVFVTRFASGACTRSTPHIYISALPFCPRSSSVYENYWKRTQNLIAVEGSPTGEWGKGAIAAWRTDSYIYSVAFSPDGTRIISGSFDHTIQVWDARTSNMVAEPFKGHTDAVLSVAISTNGTYIVSGSNDNTIRVWDARTGDTVAGPLEGHTSRVNSVAFSQDGSYIVSGSSDETIRVWDACTGNMVAGPFEGHADSVNSVAFSPDGSRIASGSYDNVIRLWDACTGDMVAGLFEGHTSWICSIAFSPDGSHIVSGSYDYTIRVWNAHTGDVVAGPLEGHTSCVNSVAFSQDGSCIVSGSNDKTIRVWDACTGNMVAGPFEGHADSVNSVAFSPDGTRIVSGSHDRTIRMWDTRTGNIVARPLEGHAGYVRSVALSPDGTHIVSGSDDTTILVWDVRSGDRITKPFEGHTGRIYSVAFSPDGTRVVSGSDDETIRVWDARTGTMVVGPFEGHTGCVSSVAFSPDGTRIISGSDDETFRMWDARTGDMVAGPFEGHTDYVCSVAFSPEGTHIASNLGNTIQVWGALTGNRVTGLFEGHTGRVFSVAFSPDGTRIISGSEDETIRIWDASTGNMVAGPFEGHTGFVCSVAFSPDGTHIVSGSNDQTIRIWNASIGNMVTGPLEGHVGPVNFVAFSPDGTHIISGSSDCIRIWDIQNESVFTDIRVPFNASAFSNHLHGTSEPSYVEDFTFSKDGWLLANNIPIFWVSPQFHAQMPHPRNTLIIGLQGNPLKVDYHNLMIGDSWSQCFH